MNELDRARLEEARKAYAGAETVMDEPQVAACYDRIAQDITTEMAELNPVVICVMLGGLQAMSEITKRLEFPFEFDYLHATRYRGETSGGELVWRVSPGIRLADRHVLVIDDIVDEGHTLASILEALRNQGTASVRTAMLLSKQHDRRASGVQIDFLGTGIEDRYVFGAGMDYKGYYRQLPAVYAVGRESETT